MSRPAFSLRWLLLVLTLCAVLCGAFALLRDTPLITLPKWLLFAAPEAITYYLPGFITQMVFLLLATSNRRRRPAAIAASIVCWLVMFSPGILAWYTWEIAGDRTANIGAGLLLMAQTVLAPLAGWIVWAAWSTALRAR